MTEPYGAVMEEALRAYGRDAGYAVTMANAAAGIVAKRQKYHLRQVVREAEATARAACLTSGRVSCAVLEACGTGSCHEARGDLRELVGVKPLDKHGPRAQPRPVPRPAGTTGGLYDVESSLVPLIKLRTANGTLPTAMEIADAAAAGTARSAAKRVRP